MEVLKEEQSAMMAAQIAMSQQLNKQRFASRFKECWTLYIRRGFGHHLQWFSTASEQVLKMACDEIDYRNYMIAQAEAEKAAAGAVH